MATRQILPNRRLAETFEIEHADKRYTVSVGFFLPGKPAEVFISGSKAGSDVESVARDGAVLLSIALQYGVPLDVMAGAITRNADGKAQTIIGAVLDQLMVSARAD
jgi:hypothetical protein